ncbi:hypothetical protein Gogos_003865, partial [Gossypium gossypioides]|nr:hypothetical protein [Gossypium gossypioides]
GVKLLKASLQSKTLLTDVFIEKKVGETYASNSAGEVGGGFVKETVTYMITDDLVVGPLPTKSIITLLNKFNVKDVVKEKVIAVGVNEEKEYFLVP